MNTETLIIEPQKTSEEILQHLQQVLADRRFVAAERNAGFLRYVVERTLEERSHEIKETVIATEVYGRSGSYDPKADSIVRVEASRLRQKLRDYYDKEGQASSIRISLPSGSYVPRFERVAQAVEPTIPAEPPALDVPAPSPPALPAATILEQDPRTAPSAHPDHTTAAAHPTLDRPSWVRHAVALSGALALLLIVLTLQTATGSKVVETHDTEALAAMQEGIALLQQDPHTAQADAGAPRTLLRAIERLEYAVARDPKIARAWTTLAEAYDYVYPYVGRDRAEDLRRAEAAARTAVALDPKFAPGHHMLGLVLGFMKWELPQAEQSYRRALALDPYSVYATVEFADLLRETGRLQEAASLIRKARALQPALPQFAAKEAEIHLDFGHADAAINAADAALQLDRSFLRAHVALASAYELKGDTSRALALYEHALAMDPMDRRALPAYGYLLGRLGKTAEAREVAQRLHRLNSTVRNCAFQVAVVYEGLGEHDMALRWLERAWHTRQPHFPFAAVDYRFRSLHTNARFQELLGRVKLKPVS